MQRKRKAKAAKPTPRLCGAKLPMSPGRLQRAIEAGTLDRYLARAGHRCRRPAMPNGRCALHGGLSTGAKTFEGRLKALANLKPFRVLDLRSLSRVAERAS